VGLPAADHNGVRLRAVPPREAEQSSPKSRSRYGHSQGSSLPFTTLLERAVDQAVESTVPLVALDLRVPEALGILQQPSSHTGDIADGESFDRGRDLVDSAHRCLKAGA
jgi:hypothetical protein